MRRDPRCWQEDDPDRIIVWKPASPPRIIEGPLELACFDGSILVLDLAAEQLALRHDEGNLLQVFLGETHRLEIGRSKKSTPPSGFLLFLRPDVPIDLRWRHESYLVINLADSSENERHDVAGRDRDTGLRLPLRGACRLQITDPMLFYGSFIQGLRHPAQDAVLSVLDTLVRARLAMHLEPLMHGGEVNRLHAQTLAADLGPADLTEDLAEFGLDCLHMAAYLPHESMEPLPVPMPVSLLPGSYDDLL